MFPSFREVYEAGIVLSQKQKWPPHFTNSGPSVQILSLLYDLHMMLYRCKVFQPL